MSSLFCISDLSDYSPGIIVVCLTTLSVARVVQCDWKVKHPISAREFGLSIKIIKIIYQTQ